MRLLLLIIFCCSLLAGTAQTTDSLRAIDSVNVSAENASDSMTGTDSLSSVHLAPPLLKSDPLRSLLRDNYLVGDSVEAISYPALKRNVSGEEFDFYYLIALFAFAGILRTVYPRYFANMFRVFFNTSLRQGQLTDQLLQAKLSSMLFNLFFVFSTGFFIYQFLQFSEVIASEMNVRILMMITAALALMYSGKYIVLKFTGWLSGFAREAETYIFIVFLVNKILGLVLLPLSLVLTFSPINIATVVAVFSLMVVLVLFLLRFFRSYGILQHRVQVNRFHFFLYIIGAEILPLLLIYKASVEILLNNA